MTHRAKQRLITGGQIGLATLAAAAVEWFYALPVMFCFISYMYSQSHPPTGAQMIRDLWPFRFVQPEWLGRTSDNRWDLLARWQVTEAGVRTFLIFLVWGALVAALVYRHRKLMRCQRT